jgi:hypothetical protein
MFFLRSAGGFMFLKKMALLAAVGGAAAVGVEPAMAAVTATGLATALGDAASILGGLEDKMMAIGGVIVGLACIGVGIKWVKGTIFS